MSAPLVVSTRDGAVWTKRTVTSSGIALYAPETVRTCPEFVMATLPELAEHGIKATAEVLPTPVEVKPLAPQGHPHTMLDRAREALNARMTKDALRLVLENVITHAAALKDRVTEMEAERHTTNGNLSDAVEAASVDRERIDELEKVAVEARVALGSLCYDLEDPGTAALGALYLLSKATTWTETGPDFAADALAQHDARVLREAQDRIEELEDELAAARVPYRERAKRETSPARRAAWLQLARTEESEERLERLLAAPANDDPAEDPCHPCGCPKRFDRHAWGCPAQGVEAGDGS